ncbi:MAG: preprotein translocase subunit TatB [Myxococcaceae bacterium]|nr:preprotein translocase subunit TatB [Myxococcaceae bacterium]
MSDGVIPDASVDITAEVCPMTYVRVKLALERLAAGGVLEVWLTGEEPLKNVPRSAREDGHQVLCIEAGEGKSRLLIRA